MIYTKYEDILMTIGKMDNEEFRENVEGYAKPIAPIIETYIHTEKTNSFRKWMKGFSSLLTEYKSYSMNIGDLLLKLQESDDCIENERIELRFMNACQNADTILLMTLILTRLLDRAAEKPIPKEERNFSYETSYDIWETLSQYETLNFQKAMEFVDLIGTNNLEKTHILKQYIKNAKCENNFCR